MATIEQRFKQIAYKPKKDFKTSELELKTKEGLFFICEELKKEDFPQPFFTESQFINLHDGFKFLTYCGKEQGKNLNKNALVIQKKLKKGDLVIYRAYLMDKEGFNIYDLFLEFAEPDTIGEHNGYNLNPAHYVGRVKERYTKKELVRIINQILTKLTEWSLNQNKI